jgi:protein-tyrosine phosphatase
MLENSDRSAEGVEIEMQRVYADFVTRCTPTFSTFLHELTTLKDDEAALFHCMAGKDRTGFAAAMLLSCLNVDRSIIEQEYLITREYFIPEIEIERIEKRYADELDKARKEGERPDHKIFYPVFDTRLNYIHSALDTIDEHWGSIDRYINEGLKLELETLELLKQQFLEES